MDHDSACTLLGAYALDACDEDETAAIDFHLLGCEPCRGEVAEIRNAAGWLGVSDSVTPPAWLREEILREAENDTVTQAEKDILMKTERRGTVGDRRSPGHRRP